MLPPEFVNQGGDPFQYELYRSFGAAGICSAVTVVNTVGGCACVPETVAACYRLQGRASRWGSTATWLLAEQLATGSCCAGGMESSIFPAGVAAQQPRYARRPLSPAHWRQLLTAWQGKLEKMLPRVCAHGPEAPQPAFTRCQSSTYSVA